MTLLSIVQTINAYLSDYILVILLIAVGLWYSVKTKFVQIRYFGEGMRRVFGNLSLKGEKHTHSMTSFQAWPLPLPLRSVPATLSVHPVQSSPAALARSSGCGSLHSSVWLPSTPRRPGHS